jgi:uncharacterized protein (TIGR01319 family)
MKLDLLVAEIGSTTTVVNGFKGIKSGHPVFLGQGDHPTTVMEGDVNIGLEGAIHSLKAYLGTHQLEYDEMLASSSAAGGLAMTVHGLVLEMTVKAAREAALGAGAIIKLVTGGLLMESDLEEIVYLRPNIILIAGGVDFGEKNVPLENCKKIKALNLDIPIIYAGNQAILGEVKKVFKDYKAKVYFVENVYPQIDRLNIEPTRKLIHQAFEEHITGAPGMQRVRELVNGPIIPTPGAVMDCARLLAESLGDLMVIDIGGATTDVHSVTKGSEEINRILTAPEPEAKRTVEGDLGVYVNRFNVLKLINPNKIPQKYNPDFVNGVPPIPHSPEEMDFVHFISEGAIKMAVNRHCGSLRYLYGPSGRLTIAEGKDLTQIKTIIGTGGVLTRLPFGKEIMAKVTGNKESGKLLPPPESNILIDSNYIMASLGVMAKKYPDAALTLLKESLGIVIR